MIMDGYIGRTVAAHVALVLAVLLALFAFTTLIGELEDVGRGGYGTWEAIQYVVLVLPRTAYQLFPTVALIGTIMGLGLLASNSELIVLRAAGISIARVVGAVMRTGLLLVVIATLLGEVVAPFTERIAQQLRASALKERIALNVEEGMWLRDGRDFVHVGEVSSDGSLHQISIYSLDEAFHLKTVISAKRGFFEGDQWRLENIARSHVSPEGVTVERLGSEGLESLFSEDILDVVKVQPEFLSAWGLYQYVNYLKENGLESDRYEQAFWRKILSPFTTAVMVFLAVPFIFGPLRSVAVGQRVLVGTMVGIGFYVIDQSFGYFGLVNTWPPLLMVAAPTLVFFGVALHLSRRLV